MEELEPYETMLEKYKVYAIIFEFVVIPAIGLLGGYVLGLTGTGIAVVAGYLGADILVMITRHKTLGGIRLSLKKS